ncbi:hypothetical protein Bbelb_132310 [Branchiostoma belcheri]|nr:hypothetical protein Bbelb_132310 [Branchiostoma belcheri]
MAISPSCSRSGLISRERETRPETCIGLVTYSGKIAAHSGKKQNSSQKLGGRCLIDTETWRWASETATRGGPEVDGLHREREKCDKDGGLQKEPVGQQLRLSPLERDGRTISDGDQRVRNRYADGKPTGSRLGQLSEYIAESAGPTADAFHDSTAILMDGDIRWLIRRGHRPRVCWETQNQRRARLRSQITTTAQQQLLLTPLFPQQDEPELAPPQTRTTYSKQKIATQESWNNVRDDLFNLMKVTVNAAKIWTRN